MEENNHKAIISVAGLIRDGLVLPEEAPHLEQVVKEFRLRLSPEIKNTAKTSAAVARQFIPSQNELNIAKEDMEDPIGDDTHSPIKGLTHRYPDRAILHVTKTCEVYCRFCFRRETVGETGHLSESDLEAALRYIHNTPHLWEIILTGGDPLVLSARRIKDLIARLSAINHIKVVRFHSRIPVVAPERISDELISALHSRLAPWIVIHANHTDELTSAARKAILHLANAGIGLLSQTVLLKDVNNNTETLEQLFRTLYQLRVKPYYLHHCDMARGVGHFRTSLAEGRAIMTQLQGRLSGPCLPNYVLDIPGGYGKAPIGPNYLTRLASGQWQVSDWVGENHHYLDPA